MLWGNFSSHGQHKGANEKRAMFHSEIHCVLPIAKYFQHTFSSVKESTESLLIVLFLFSLTNAFTCDLHLNSDCNRWIISRYTRERTSLETRTQTMCYTVTHGALNLELYLAPSPNQLLYFFISFLCHLDHRLREKFVTYCSLTQPVSVEVYSHEWRRYGEIIH